MDRLAELVVAWHNRHPLAKQITIYDVHTIGVVALPFMRNAQADAAARQVGAGGKVEPVLTDEVSPESLAAAWDEEGLTVAANPNAAHLDALADQEPPPNRAKAGWRDSLSRLMFWRKTEGNAAKTWPVFSERFVSHLSPRRIAAFALAHGYTRQPGDATWPQRIVPIDEQLMESSAANGRGAWPFELYLMSAAIDAGRSRSRILIGHGRQPAIAGARCLSPQRLGLLALLLLSLLGAGAALLLPAAKKQQPAPVELQVAAAAASAASLPLTAPVAASLPAASAPQAGASTPMLPASAATPTAVAGASMPPASSASEVPQPASAAQAKAPEQAEERAPPRPDIRPMFIKPIPGRSAPPLGASMKSEAASAAPSDSQNDPKRDAKKDAKPAEKIAVTEQKPPAEPIEVLPQKPKARSALANTSKAIRSAAESPSTTEAAVANSPPVATEYPPSSKAIAKAATLVNKPVVALVGPVSASKAEAEATLARMRSMLAPTQAGASGSSLQTQVFQTPEGYRPAIWPFASREEAQLINATLIARGMRTRAVDF